MRIFKKIRSLVLSTALIVSTFISTIPVFACEQPLEADTSIVEITNPEEIENAIELFGFSEEEAENVRFYEATTRSVATIEHGVTQMPSFTLYDYNRGSDRIFNGTKLKTSIVIKGEQYTNLHVRFCSYDEVEWTCDMKVGDEGNDVYKSGWYDIRYGGTYYMTYERLGGSGSLNVTVIFALY